VESVRRRIAQLDGVVRSAVRLLHGFSRTIAIPDRVIVQRQRHAGHSNATLS
jgi:hypothetical protein